jgi:O-succinylbenzoic acid--CoA ligase
MSAVGGHALGDTLSVLDAASDEPDRLALLTDGTARTFSDVASRVERRVAGLAAAGLLDPRGERPVSLDAHPSLDVLETVLALLHAGTPFLPLHPRLTPPEKQQLEALAGAVRVSPSALPVSAAALKPRLAFDPERIAALVATSGSTGTPRLARLSHRALLAGAHASAAHLGVTDDDRTLLALPLGHVGGLMTFVRALVGRRTLVPFDPGASLLARLPELSEALVEHRVTQLSVVPALLDRLLAPEVGLVPGSLRAVLVGGAACSRPLLVRAHERGLPVLTTYGLTEACAQVATRRYAEREEPPPPEGAPATIGVALPGVELRVVDGVAELRSRTLFSGYVGQPASDPTGGWFRTGDRAFVTPEGELVLRGRVSDVIITGGENVDPAEVEAALEGLPGIAEACVLGLPDPTFGETVGVLFVPSGPASTPEEWLAELQARVARYKLPRRWLAVRELPKLPSGKLDRRTARERHGTDVAGLPLRWFSELEPVNPPHAK